MTQLNRLARTPVCGAIATYNLTSDDVDGHVQTTPIKKDAMMGNFTLVNFTNYFTEAAK